MRDRNVTAGRWHKLDIFWYRDSFRAARLLRRCGKQFSVGVRASDKCPSFSSRSAESGFFRAIHMRLRPCTESAARLEFQIINHAIFINVIGFISFTCGWHTRYFQSYIISQIYSGVVCAGVRASACLFVFRVSGCRFRTLVFFRRANSLGV